MVIAGARPAADRRSRFRQRHKLADLLEADLGLAACDQRADETRWTESLSFPDLMGDT